MKHLISAFTAILYIMSAYGQNSYSIEINENYNSPQSYMWNKGDDFYTGTIENGIYISKAGRMHAQLTFGNSLYDKQEKCINSSDMEYTIVKLKGSKESFICVQIDPNGDKAYSYLVFQYNELGDWKLTNYLQDQTYSSGKATTHQGTAANIIRIEHRNNKVIYFLNAEKVTELTAASTLEIRWYNNKIYSNDKKIVLGLDNVFLGGCVTDKEELEKQAKKKEMEEQKILSANYELFCFSDFKTNKCGFKDADGKIVIPAKYDEVSRDKCFSEGLAAVKLNGKWGYINKTGKEVVELKYDYVSDFLNGFAVVKLGKFDGVINKMGKEIISPKYLGIRNNVFVKDEAIADGMVMVQNNGYGFCDTNGVEIIVPKYEAAKHFSEEFAAVSIKNKWGFIDKTGKEVVPIKYDAVGYFSEDLCAVNIGGEEKGKWGFIDKTGKQIIENKYSSVSPFSEGLALVQIKEQGNYEFIDKSGKTILTPKYSFVCSFSEGLAVVANDYTVPGEDFLKTKFGCIDKTGKEVIPVSPELSIVNEYFSEGLIVVEKDQKLGYMDKTGNVIISYKYNQAGPFKNGKAFVKLGNKTFYIDKTGQELK